MKLHCWGPACRSCCLICFCQCLSPSIADLCFENITSYTQLFYELTYVKSQRDIFCLLLCIHLKLLWKIVFKKKNQSREFPGCPALRTPCFHCWAQVQSLVTELRFHKAHSTAQRKAKKVRQTGYIQGKLWDHLQQRLSSHHLLTSSTGCCPVCLLTDLCVWASDLCIRVSKMMLMEG